MRISQTSIFKNKKFVWSEFLTLRCIRKGTIQTICEGAFSRKQQCRRALGFIFMFFFFVLLQIVYGSWEDLHNSHMAMLRETYGTVQKAEAFFVSV